MINRLTLEASSTPLASIFGSGFLVMIPILAGTVGAYAPLAILAVCVLAYIIGSVIRFNIHYAEPLLAGHPKAITLNLERLSDLSIIVAYVVSICLYLHIMSAFVLSGLDTPSIATEDILTTTAIVVIVGVGITKGLSRLEFLEKWSLYITLAIILLILVGFFYDDWAQWQIGKGFTYPAMPDHSLWQIATILGGTLIVVQGFETSRYMGGVYKAQTRIAASRLSQCISTGVYVVFVLLALPSIHALGGNYSDDSLIKLVTHVSPFLVIPLIIAAALSQFSAAVADTIAALGNVEEVSHRRVPSQIAYLVIGAGAIALTWTAETMELVALASRAFAFYYLLQCLVAISVSNSYLQRAAISALAGVLAFITIFAVPVG